MKEFTRQDWPISRRKSLKFISGLTTSGGTYRTDQAKTRKLFTVTREHLYDLIGELDDDDPTDQAKTTVVKGIDKKLTDKFKEDDEAVKERMFELIKEF